MYCSVSYVRYPLCHLFSTLAYEDLALKDPSAGEEKYANAFLVSYELWDLMLGENRNQWDDLFGDGSKNGDCLCSGELYGLFRRDELVSFWLFMCAGCSASNRPRIGLWGQT